MIVLLNQPFYSFVILLGVHTYRTMANSYDANPETVFKRAKLFERFEAFKR